jgi:hypothetical protein
MSFLRKVLHTFHDVLTGGHIVWYQDSYSRYILGTGHSTARPDIGEYIDVIRQAVENPSNITEDRDYPDRTCYYLWFTGNKDYPTSPHMKVVVGKSLLWGKEIITCYFTAYAGSREKQIPWIKP